MKFILEVKMDNAAFEDRGYEMGRILDKIATDIDNGMISNVVKDSNGNTVGSFRIED